MENFFNWIRVQAKNISASKQKFRQLIISDKEKEELYASSGNCVICNKHLINDRVVHHDHATGKMFMLAYNECNLKQRTQSFTPVFFHNLSRYDSHHLIRYLDLEHEEKLTVVPCTEENYISFSLHIPVGSYINKKRVNKIKFEEMRFLDTFRFLPDSLKNPSKSLSQNDFNILQKYFPDDRLSSLMSQKGIYLYSFIDSFEKFDEKRPPTFGLDWVNALSGTIDISEEEVRNAEYIWKFFGCKSMGDYHDLYLQSDVLLLADVFESFRKLFKDTYCSDPCHYYSTPNISWDAMLKTTGISLELLSDIDMLLFCEKAIRGVLNGIGEKRFMKANIEYVPDYDRARPSTYGLFLDVVNLYGGTMTKHMPTGDFKWVNVSF